MNIIGTIKSFRSFLDYGKIVRVVLATLDFFFDELDRTYPSNTPA